MLLDTGCLRAMSRDPLNQVYENLVKEQCAQDMSDFN